MKVFFTASLRGQNEFGKFYKTIYSAIEKKNYKNLDNEILVLSEKYYNDIQKAGRTAFINLYQRKLKNLQIADICIFEGSLPSLSIGYLIQKALDFNKPVIILYYKENVPQFIAGINEEKLIVKNYNDSNLLTVLDEAIQEARNLQDKRFNFFISPSLLNYLEKASNKEGITKSTFIRNLIIAHRKKNA